MYRKQKRYSFPQTLDPTTHSIKGVHTFIHCSLQNTSKSQNKKQIISLRNQLLSLSTMFLSKISPLSSP